MSQCGLQLKMEIASFKVMCCALTLVDWADSFLQFMMTRMMMKKQLTCTEWRESWSAALVQTWSDTEYKYDIFPGVHVNTLGQLSLIKRSGPLGCIATVTLYLVGGVCILLWPVNGCNPQRRRGRDPASFDPLYFLLKVQDHVHGSPPACFILTTTL